MQMQTAEVDIAIVGGGIAGLWLLHRVRQLGFTACLFEANALGGGQTNKSQGIIHGGLKYALNGVMNDEAHALNDLPALWRACLRGEGEIDLSGVNTLSAQQFLFSPSKFAAKLARFFAQKTLSSSVHSIPREHYPPIFNHPAFKGELFALDEIVLDVPSLIRELVKCNQDAVYQIEPYSDEELQFSENGKLKALTVYSGGSPIQIHAQQFIFTAGSGNEIILRKNLFEHIRMQRRPLHMVLVKTPFKDKLFGHCLGLSAKPRLTITSHRLQDGTQAWYLGGQLAEDGVNLTSEKQIAAAKAELKNIFSWLNFSNAQFATFHIDRAEPAQTSNLKPDKSFVQSTQNVMVAWPTKLALTPKLVSDVIAQLAIQPAYADTRALRSLPMPPLALPIWEKLLCTTAV